MSKLRKSIKAMHKADNNPVTALPVYGAGGYTPSKKKSLSVKPFLFLGAVILVLLVIYLPEVFYKEHSRRIILSCRQILLRLKRSVSIQGTARKWISTAMGF